MKVRHLKWSAAGLIVLMAMLFLIGCGDDSVQGPDVPAGKVEKVSAYSKVSDTYHQLNAIVVQYSENVAAPAKTGYTVIDNLVSKLRDDFMRGASNVAPIVAVYTNSEPKIRSDKTSVTGKYVIVELEPTSYCLPADASGVNMANHAATMATIRTTAATDRSEYLRKDWSDLVVTQKVDVLSPNGYLVASAGTLPALTYQNITHLEIDRFKQAVFVNSQGQEVNYSIYVPANYDKTKSYPLIYYVTGGGGRLNYLQTDSAGNFTSLGGPVTRDRFGLAATQLPEDAIVVLPQFWTNVPASWNNDSYKDAVDLLEHLLAKYSINRKRVYAAGSSYGTMVMSTIMKTRADLVTAYVQCNGHWEGYPDAFAVENMTKLTNKDIAYIDALPRLPKDAAYLDKARISMGNAVANRTRIWVFHGVNDQTAPSPRGVSTYEAFRALYQEQGLSAAEIDGMVKITLMEDPLYLKLGVSERHNSVPPSIKYHPELFTWLLQQSK